MTAPSPEGRELKLPLFVLQRGVTLPEARLVYQTHGVLNPQRSNAVLYPTSYGAQHPDVEWLIGPGKILDTTRYFVIACNMFGNGLSSSPSNLPEPFAGTLRATFTHTDNLAAQHRLVVDELGIEKLALVYGWSMGGQQALHWAVRHPERVERVVAICATARTTPHNRVFLEGLRSALQADPHWTGERFAGRPLAGLRAFARVYAGWALSQAFYRNELWRGAGYSSLEDFLLRDWEAGFLRRDPANLLSMIDTWLQSDVSDNPVHRGDLERALAGIRARTLLIPARSDLYFTEEDILADAGRIPGCQVATLVSPWGHRAGNPAKSPADAEFLRSMVQKLLRE
ncbi:MAG: alpha/beta fold hydrolase [Planctomycetaceae bacterium]